MSMDYARKDELSKRHVMSRYRAVEAWWAGACVDSDYARKRQVVKMARSEQVQGCRSVVGWGLRGLGLRAKKANR